MLDEPSVSWGDPRWSRLHGLLVDAYRRSDEARHLLERVSGFPVGKVNWENSGGLDAIWRNVLDVAAASGTVPTLLDVVIADPLTTAFRQPIQAVVAELSVAPIRSDRADAGAGGWSTRPASGAVRPGQRLETVLGSYRSKIDDIVAGARDLPSGADLVRLLWIASPDIGPLPVRPLTDLPAVLDALDERMAARGRMPPVLAFLEYLCVRARSRAEAIREVIEEVVRSHRIDLEDLTAVRTRARAAGATQASPTPVGVHIRVHLDEDGRLSPAALLYGANCAVSYKQDGPPRPAPEIRRTVETLIDRFQPLLQGFDLAELRFEFAVPWTMLGEALDHWQFPDGRELGSRSQVVVRSLDRMLAPILEAAWRKRSRFLRDCSTAAVDEVVGLLEPDSPAGAGIVDREKLGCLVVARPYTPPASWRDDHSVLDGIKDGLPAAIWYRQGGEPEELLALLRTAAATGRLTGIPAAVLRLRQRARAHGTDHPHRHITLLWDDFAEQPDSATLREPSSRGGTR